MCYGVKVISMAASSLLHHKALSMLSGPWMAPQKWAPHMYQPINCSTGECKWVPFWNYHNEIVHQNVILYLYYWPEVRSSLLLLWCWEFPKIIVINTYSSPVSAWYRLLCELKLWFTIVLYFSIQWQINDRNSTQKLLNLWDGILCISWHI